MATAQSVIDSARYDLVDYVDGVGMGIDFDDVELLNYLNRMIGLLDATLSSLNSNLVFATEPTMTSTANLDYIDISNLNSGLWSRIREVWWDGNTYLVRIGIKEMYYTRKYRKTLLEGAVSEGDSISEGDYIQIIAQAVTDFTTLGAADNNAGTYFTATSDSGNLPAGDVVWKFNSSSPNLWALEGNKILFPTVPGTSKYLVIHYDKKTAELALTDSMPYSDIFNEFIREMLVQCAKAKRHGLIERPDVIFNDFFKRRAMQEEISRGFIPKNYNYKEF